MSEVKEQGKSKKTGLLERLKSVKHIEIIVVAVFACVVLLVIFNGFGTATGGASGGGSDELSEYARGMEQRLAEVLSDIEGAGKVSVMLHFDSSAELVPALEGGDKMVIVGGKPVIIRQIQPKVSGVIVVAEGASNIKVKLELFKAVQTLLDVDQKCIEIFTMSKK